VGIHLIVATQRPQANVVTGLIKSNMPCRVSFKVASGMDSRIVLDQKGGELLLGQGDMLFLHPRTSKLVRAQGCLIDDLEIRKTVKFLKTVSQQSFEPQLVQLKGSGSETGLDANRDPLFDDAVEIVLETQRGSVSLLQRRLTIGYSRASRLIEEMEAAGILGSHKTAQAREVQIGVDEWEAIKAQAKADAEAMVVDEDRTEQAGDFEEVDEVDQAQEQVVADDEEGDKEYDEADDEGWEDVEDEWEEAGDEEEDQDKD
jgi:S-DNA-T family DNA segregation ATPase FtsK/SpoIIIE